MEENSCPKFEFTINGQSPLLLHSSSVDASDLLDAWRKNPENKGVSKKGDDRSPAFTWILNLHHDSPQVMIDFEKIRIGVDPEALVAVPADMIMASLRGGAATMTLSGKKSFKEASQCGIYPCSDFFPVLVDGKPIKMADVLELWDVKDFRKHPERAAELGIELFINRCRVGQAQHVRVRPRFNNWSLRGEFELTVKELNGDVLKTMFEQAGKYKGLGDWRPGSPKSPGRFGRYETVLKEIKQKAASAA